MTIDIPSFNLEEAKKIIIEKCINSHMGFSQSAVAKILGISLQGLRNFIDTYKIEWTRASLTEEKLMSIFKDKLDREGYMIVPKIEQK